jgi:hypothetical protein
MISSRSFFTRILAALAVLISVCYGGARLATAQYSPAGGNTFGGATYPLTVADAAGLSGPVPVLSGGTGATTIGVVGTSSYGAGANFNQTATQVTWQIDGGTLGGGVVSFLTPSVEVTTASTYVTCMAWQPSQIAQLVNTAGEVNVHVTCLDATAYYDGGGVYSGKYATGYISFGYSQVGTDAGGLAVTANPFAQTFAPGLLISAQIAGPDGGWVYPQVEVLDGGSTWQCECVATNSMGGL